MRRATVADVMTTDVVTVRPGTPFNDIVRLLAQRRISGVPVVGPGGRVLGVVSESDLLRKEEFKSSSEEFTQLFESPHHRRIREQAEAGTAAEVMSTPAVTVIPADTIVMASRLLATRDFKRLPVVTADGGLAGIVTRGDLLRVFLRPDEDIQNEIAKDIVLHYLWRDSDTLDVDVANGVVTLKGHLGRKSLVPVALRLAWAVEGVVRVVDELNFDHDDIEAYTS